MAVAELEELPTWPDLLQRLIRGDELLTSETGWAMDPMMKGDVSPAQIAGFLVALRAKGENVNELTGLVDSMLRHAVPIAAPTLCVDVVGTGGDRAHTVNISTMAALVVGSTGACVVKHGNRAASSACGSADVLEELGVRLDLPAERVVEVVHQVGITFCFAQVFHPAMRHVAITRRELGVPTIFNFLGPLTNPARPTASAVGVADRRMAPLMAGVLAERGTSALVFRGDDGLDELTTSGTSSVWLVLGGRVVEISLDPARLGVAPSPIEALRGGDAGYNAAVVRQVLTGQRGPIRDAVLLNAAAALVAVTGADPQSDVTHEQLAANFDEQMFRALTRVGEAVDSGAAAELLDRWIDASRE